MGPATRRPFFSGYWESDNDGRPRCKDDGILDTAQGDFLHAVLNAHQ